MTEVDHLVVAARSLDDGVAWCEAALGITPGPGGQHALMGTHNRLFGIGSAAFPRAYFEIIAIDPQAAAPGRARWFGMDALDLSRGPRLVNVVARTTALDALLDTLRRTGIDGGRALAASRETPAGLLRWRIAVRDDGALLHGGAMPTLIEWGERHPAETMPASGVVLRSITLRGLAPAAFDSLAWQDVRRLDTPGPAIEARLDTPRGPVSIASH
jgi:Glyoxalase-like domain